MSEEPLFPIKDLEFHKNGLRELDVSSEDLETLTLAHWHVIAIGFLEYGSIKGFDGPAAEVTVNLPNGRRKIFPKKVEPFLRLTKAPNGHPRFEPVFPSEEGES